MNEFSNVPQILLIESKIRDIISSDKYERLTEQQKLALRTFVDTANGKVKDRFPED